MSRRHRLMPRLRAYAVPTLGLVLAALEVSGLAVVSLRHDSVAPVRSRPAVAAAAVLPPLPLPLPVAPTPVPTPTATPRPSDPLRPARGLDAWIDLYDYGSQGRAAAVRLVDKAARHGVRSLWVETSRYNTDDIAYPRALGALVDEARARGLTLVAWTLPRFRSVKADEHKAAAAMAFRSSHGHRFSALGLDIEISSGASPKDRSARLIRLARRVAADIRGPSYGIVPPPIGFDRHPTYWPGFPWQDLAGNVDALVTMGYWTYSSAHPGKYTRDVIAQTRARVGQPDYPVVVIGGLAADTTPHGVEGFCRAGIALGASGAGLYDLASTPRRLWSPLQDCRSVGR